MRHFIFLVISIFLLNTSHAQYDVCVYGGTSAGVIAAYTAAKNHKKVVLIEPGKHLGGLSSGGLGYTDIGNKYVVTGLARDFYRRIGKHYGKFETWIFEPHVAEKIFNDYTREANVPVLYQYRIISATKENGSIQNITIENAGTPSASTNKIISAKMFIDCSYEGDLMAKAGVSYTVGREDNSVYNEVWNGYQLQEHHQFPDGIDPYEIPGDPASGLVWGVSNNKPLPTGTGNKMVQAYNFRLCLTDDPKNKIDITKPDDYDALRYELLLRGLDKKPAKDLDGFMKVDHMPNRKTDINNNGGFSTDMIGMNYDYPEGDYTTRQKIIEAHENYTKGFLYFIGHDERMPQYLRQLMLQWGYPKDEYKDNKNFTSQLYIRESRRMIGSYVMTQDNCEGRATIGDGVGMAAYTMDSHNCERLVVNGMVKNEGDVEKGGFGPYPVSYRALIPKAEDCNNLYVPVCLSASHIAYGSIRMEPVFMVLAQSCAAAASMAIDAHETAQQVDIQKLQQLLKGNPLMDGSTPEVLVDDNDSRHVQVNGPVENETRGGYGLTWLKMPVSKTPSTITYTPDIQASGSYTIYAYIPLVEQAATTHHYTVINNGVTKDIRLATPAEAEGQTSGEWVSLGTYTLGKGKKTSVVLSTKGSDGIVTADALLFVPEKRGS